MKRTGTSHLGAQCMKWWGRLAWLGLHKAIWAQVGSSVAAQDPWLALAGPLENRGGAAAVLHHTPLGEGRSMWCGRRRLFGLEELQSQGLALSSDSRLGRWGVGLHHLRTEFWREEQAVLRWSPGRAADATLDWSLGLEGRRQWAEGGGRHARTLPALDVAWQAGALHLSAGTRIGLPVTVPAWESCVTLGYKLPRGWGLCWQADQADGRRRESASLIWRHSRGGVGVGWKEGRGWEVAARLRWKSVHMGVSWWNHPVLPPTDAWAITWLEEARP